MPMKVFSTSFAMREIKTKTVFGFHLTPVRMGIMKKAFDHNADRDVEGEEP